MKVHRPAFSCAFLTLALMLRYGYGALPKNASDMEAAHGADASAIADEVVAAAPSDPIPRGAYAESVMREFDHELDSHNPDARLNTAIIFAKLNALTCDVILEKMLANNDSTIRLWGARGLGMLAPIIKSVGGVTLKNALDKLQNAQKTESNDDVAAEIAKALAIL